MREPDPGQFCTRFRVLLETDFPQMRRSDPQAVSPGAVSAIEAGLPWGAARVRFEQAWA